MKIAFADFSGFDYHARTVDEKPMGGTQSAVCYLSRALATAGHEVSLIGAGSITGEHGGVRSIPTQVASDAYLRAMRLDALICVLGAGHGRAFRNALGSNTRLILWTGHDADQPALLPLFDPGEREAYDGLAMVSEWQRERFIRAFNFDPSCASVLRNAIAPAFENLFAEDASIVAAKSNPPILGYTSTPFRGLDVLLDCFADIRRAVPDARLEVFSSMSVYQMSGADDQASYGALYHRCRETAGVDYVGSLSQRELAGRLRRVTLLAYPNTFAETSCIAVMEAMASGCRIVTSDLGALSETTAGFARLISPGTDRPTYQAAFASAVVESLREARLQSAGSEMALREQVSRVNNRESWADRADQWLRWIGALPAHRPADPLPTLSQLCEGAINSCRYGRFTDAEPLCRQIIARDPSHVDALHLLGLIAAHTGRIDEGIGFFQQTVAASPKFAEGFYNLGSALKERGRIGEAVSAYQQAISIKPDFEAARNSLDGLLPSGAQSDHRV